MIYEVIIKANFVTLAFQFDSGESACEFAESVVAHHVVAGEDKIDKVFINLKNPEKE